MKPRLFAALVLPYAFTASVTALLIPYLLREHGVVLDRIANIVAIASLPAIWSFLWAPLADVGPPKRTLVVLSSLGAGVAGCAAILAVEGSHVVLTALLFLMNAFGGLLSCTCGALLAAMPERLRGVSAGWYQGANTGGTALGGAGLIWLADHADVAMLGAIVLVAMLLPAIAAVRVREPEVVRGKIGERVAALWGDVKALMRSRHVWTRLVFLLSPVGSAAVGHLISGMGPDYGVSGTQVMWVAGIGGGVFAALGSLLGGVTADRIGRLFAYPLGGALACAFALYLGFGGATPRTYALGYLGYSLAAGFAYAVYTAIVLDAIGRREHAAASGYAVLNSAGNLPIAYMTWLDGAAYRHWGAQGTMAVDAAANGVAAAVLLAAAVAWRRR